ncbi:MAG TPA: polymer-forming cytoskeletal protein [Kofleriaceae bacterium]|nr:polymer-forming cytoskeletal protein [Kofleriaceae bacterium]
MSIEHQESQPGTVSSGAGRIGRGIRIKGVIRGKEDLVVEGEVDGTIHLPEHHVVLDLPSRTTAEVRARNTTIRGRHRGNAEASDKLEITSEARMIGDIKAPRLVIREGASFRGAVEMEVPLPPDLDLGPAAEAAGKGASGKKRAKQAD